MRLRLSPVRASYWVAFTAVAVLALAGLGCTSAPRDPVREEQRQPIMAPRTPDVKSTLELAGSGLERPRAFAFEQLSAMDMVEVNDVMMLKSHEPDEVTSWRGPSLAGLLKAAGVESGPMLLEFEAADGYGFDLPLDELGGAIVAVQDGAGRWLADLDKNCPLRLVIPDKPANYWVMNLSRIVVEPISEAGPSQ